MIFVEDGVMVLPSSAGINVNSFVHNANIGNGSVVYATANIIGGGITGFNGGEADRVLIIQPTRNSTEVIALYDANAGSIFGNRLLNNARVTDEMGFWGSCRMYIFDTADGYWKQV